MEYSARFVLKWSAAAFCVGGVLLTLPLQVSAGAPEPPPRLLAQAPSQSSSGTYSTETVPQANPGCGYARAADLRPTPLDREHVSGESLA